MKTLLILFLFICSQSWAVERCIDTIPPQTPNKNIKFQLLNHKARQHILKTFHTKIKQLEEGLLAQHRGTLKEVDQKKYVLNLLITEAKKGLIFFKKLSPKTAPSLNERKQLFKYINVYIGLFILDIKYLSQKNISRELMYVNTERLNPGSNGFTVLDPFDGEKTFQLKVLFNFFNKPLDQIKNIDIETLLGHTPNLYNGILPSVFDYATSYETTTKLYSEGLVSFFLASSYESGTHGGLHPPGYRIHDLQHIRVSTLFRMYEFLIQYKLNSNPDLIKNLTKLIRRAMYKPIPSIKDLHEINNTFTGKILEDFNTYEKTAQANLKKLIKKINQNSKFYFVLFIITHEVHFTGLTPQSLNTLKDHLHPSTEIALADHTFEGSVMGIDEYTRTFDDLILLMEQVLKEESR